MTDVQWLYIRSWHVFRTFTRLEGVGITVCGRRADTKTLRDDRPGNERTCESCLRTLAK